MSLFREICFLARHLHKKHSVQFQWYCDKCVRLKVSNMKHYKSTEPNLHYITLYTSFSFAHMHARNHTDMLTLTCKRARAHTHIHTHIHTRSPFTFHLPLLVSVGTSSTLHQKQVSPGVWKVSLGLMNCYYFSILCGFRLYLAGEGWAGAEKTVREKGHRLHCDSAGWSGM